MDQTGDASVEHLPNEGLSQAARVQILATEHWSLLSTRTLSWTEAFNRSSMFLTSLTGSVVALALVAQAKSDAFLLFALLLLPIVYFLGLTTYVRLVFINREDGHWVLGMNRLRHAYLELAPDLEQYFITSQYDDVAGIMTSVNAPVGTNPLLHVFVTTPGMLAVVVGLVGGVLIGLIAATVGAAQLTIIGGGVIGFVLTVAGLMYYQYRVIYGYAKTYKPRFPSK
jgi:hypothetical protein